MAGIIGACVAAARRDWAGMVIAVEAKTTAPVRQAFQRIRPFAGLLAGASGERGGAGLSWKRAGLGGVGGEVFKDVGEAEAALEITENAPGVTNARAGSVSGGSARMAGA